MPPSSNCKTNIYRMKVLFFFCPTIQINAKVILHQDKRPMGRITGKHFLAINKLEQSYDFTNRSDKSLYHLPLEKGMALQLNNSESPSHKNASCYVWLKLEKKTLKCHQCISTILLLSPLEIGCGPTSDYT